MGRSSPNTSVLKMGPKAGGNVGMVGGRMESFANVQGLVIGERVDHEAANAQVQRADELRELIQLGHEENFNMFDLVPKTPMDNYLSKLTAGALKTVVVSTSEDNVDRDIQTEELTTENAFNQAPEDFMKTYPSR